MAQSYALGIILGGHFLKAMYDSWVEWQFETALVLRS